MARTPPSNRIGQCAIFVIFLDKSYKSAYRPPPSNRRSRCAICDFSGQELQKCISQTALVSTQPLCDIGFVIFSCQELRKCISHTALESNRSMCDIGFVISCQELQKCISHASIESVSVRYCFCDFLVQSCKSPYRTPPSNQIGQCQPSATRPPFLDNLHVGQIAKSVNHQSRLTLLAICPQWRLSKKGD